MTTVKRISAAAVASVTTVALIFGVLTIFPSRVVGGVFVMVGVPLGWLILLITPRSFIREIAPSGGPDAVGWAIGIGAFVTWFVLFLSLWYLVLPRMRSNNALLTDTSASPLRAQHGAAKRER